MSDVRPTIIESCSSCAEVPNCFSSIVETAYHSLQCNNLDNTTGLRIPISQSIGMHVDKTLCVQLPVEGLAHIQQQAFALSTEKFQEELFCSTV